MPERVLERLVTLDDLEQLPDDGSIYEVVGGVLFKMPPTKPEQGIIIATIAALLHNFNHGKSLGYIFTGSGVQLTDVPLHLRAPDVAFVSTARFKRTERGYAEDAPDLAVEVISPSERLGYMRKKLQDYFSNDVVLVWFVYPAARVIEVYTSPDAFTTLTMDDMLDGGAVLPGFAVKVQEIFAGLPV
jgi:Uma2 family endonuclease